MPATATWIPDRAGQERLTHSPTGPYGRWLLQVGNRAVSRAKARANVRTGLMRSRIEFYVEVRGGQVVGVLVARTRYAKFVHDGTRYYRGTPFLRDAIRDTLR